MAFTWQESGSLSVSMDWSSIQEYISVDPEKELIRVHVAVITKGLNSAGFVDNIIVKESLNNAKITGSYVTQIPIEQLSAGTNIEIPIFGTVKNSKLVAAHIMPQSTVIGSNTNYFQLNIIRKEDNALMATRTFLEGTNINAYEVFPFGPVDGTNEVITELTGISLKVESEGSGLILPRSILILEWNLN